MSVSLDSDRRGGRDVWEGFFGDRRVEYIEFLYARRFFPFVEEKVILAAMREKQDAKKGAS